MKTLIVGLTFLFSLGSLAEQKSLTATTQEKSSYGRSFDLEDVKADETFMVLGEGLKGYASFRLEGSSHAGTVAVVDGRGDTVLEACARELNGRPFLFENLVLPVKIVQKEGGGYFTFQPVLDDAPAPITFETSTTQKGNFSFSVPKKGSRLVGYIGNSFAGSLIDFSIAVTKYENFTVDAKKKTLVYFKDFNDKDIDPDEDSQFEGVKAPVKVLVYTRKGASRLENSENEKADVLVEVKDVKVSE